MWVWLFVSQRRLNVFIVAQDLLACVLVRCSGGLSKSPGEPSLKMRGELCIMSNSGIRRRRMGKHGGVLVLQSIYVRVGVGRHVLVKRIVVVKRHLIVEMVFSREPHDRRIRIHIRAVEGSRLVLG